jgi:hypothetical protein
LSFKAKSQLLSPVSRAVALVKALEETFMDLTNTSATVVSLESQLTETSKLTEFLTVRRLGSTTCKNARVVSQSGILGRAEFFLDGNKIIFPQEYRGFGIVTIDPDTLELSGTPVSFDTYGDIGSVGRLTKHLNELRYGSIVLIGLSDSGLEQLNAGALAAFHRIGAAVQRFGDGQGFRQPYAFIGQVGNQSIKELWSISQDSKVAIEGTLPCIESSIVNAVMVAQGGDNSDAALSSLAKRFGNLKPEDFQKQLSAKLATSNIAMPIGTSVEFGKMSEVCPDHQVWTVDKCTLPGPIPDGGNGGFPLWAKVVLAVLGALLILCCLVALSYFCCRRKDREEQLVVVDPSSQARAAPAKLTDEAEQRCKRAFALIDKNGNGKLSRAEVIKACRESEEVRRLLGLPKVIRQQDGSRDRFEAVFQRLDGNASKAISQDEFASLFLSNATTRASESDSRYPAIDDGR